MIAILFCIGNVTLELLTSIQKSDKINNKKMSTRNQKITFMKALNIVINLAQYAYDHLTSLTVLPINYPYFL